jgi:4-amino-4-deoxy-L-arabinose transferase-like glycosyltransferase
MRMDSLLLLGMLLSLLGWAYRHASWGAAAMFGGITVAVLSKGPLGFAPVPLIACHALLLRTYPVTGKDWRWALLLLPIAAWYATLVGLHGARPFSELGADTLRATATPQLDVWQSIYQEYVIKPARRYWPWLPFMFMGSIIAVRRSFDTQLAREMRVTYVWTLLWLIVVVAMAVVKPDRDIRYFYPALPVLALFTGIALATLTRDRLPTFVPVGLLGVVVAVLLFPGQASWRPLDTRETIRAIRTAMPEGEQTLAIGGYPVPPGQPRRQNTHRDWVHFYTGSVPRVLSWDQTQAQTPEFGGGVFMTRSRGHRERLTEFGLEAKYVTTEMIFAVPE